jgi:hypothetical protein
MVEKTGPEAGATDKTWMARLGKALEGAHAALVEGELEDAERRARAVSALVRAIRETHALREAIAAPGGAPEDGESRTKFLRRVAGYMEPARARELLQRLAAEGHDEDGGGLGDLGA